jgi:hypothetical protein
VSAGGIGPHSLKYKPKEGKVENEGKKMKDRAKG